MNTPNFVEDLWSDAPWPFRDATRGNGCFGTWLTDDRGAPAYRHAPPEERAQEDHWHLLGNDRINATAHSAGYVQIYDWGRGGKCVNRWAPGRGAYAGGFKYVLCGGRRLCTLRARLPSPATQTLMFGTGYVEKTTCWNSLRLLERIEAPAGDDPVLLSTSRITNDGAAPITLTLVEFWAADLYQLLPLPVMTHGLDRLWDRVRHRINRRFRISSAWDSAHAALTVSFRAHRLRPLPPAEETAHIDYYPQTLFLAALGPLPEGFGAYASDARAFFADAAVAEAPGAAGAADGSLLENQRATGGAVLSIRRTLDLGPGETAELRYLFGYGAPESIPDLCEAYREFRGKTRATVDLAVPRTAWLGRELQWHAYYLQAGSLYSEYFESHFVDQGSAYSYLQGGSGAHRDFALFTLPMVYLRPDLARDMLRFSLRAQHHGTGALPYVHLGHGKVSGAVVHRRSSDLDLFVLWALAEYLNATRDYAFLQEVLPYFPHNAGHTGTVLEHARTAFRHLTQRVGLGPHGMLRCGSGDWNDVLLAFSRHASVTATRGESSLNAGLATVALPAMAAAVEHTDQAFADALRCFAGAQAEALRALWTGDWVARGHLGYGGAVLGEDRIFLDTQGFGVLGGVWNSEQAARIFDNVQKLCVDPQPAGALCLYPPMRGPLLEPGSDTNGGTWAAIDAWTAWAWSRVDPEAAWRFFERTTLAARADAFPDVWYGVWSGPDAYNAHYHPRPGETFNLNATPMTLFPVMNMNRHAGPLLAAIKLAGIQPEGRRIVIDPRIPLESFALRLPLVGLAYEPGRCRGYYAPLAGGNLTLAVRPPAGAKPDALRLRVNGNEQAALWDTAGRVAFTNPSAPGERICWELC